MPDAPARQWAIQQRTRVERMDDDNAQSDGYGLETLWNRLFDNAFDEIYLFTAEDLYLLRASPSAHHHLGYDEAGIAALNLQDIAPDLTPAWFDAQSTAWKKNEQQPLRLETRLRRRDGSLYPVEVRLQYLASQQPSAFLITARVTSTTQITTDRTEAETELKKHCGHLQNLLEQRTIELKSINQELETFSYSVSHDLRAPLRHIDGFSQLLLDDYSNHLDEEGKAHLSRIRGGAQRMGKLIDDLLQLSRVARGKLQRESLKLGPIAMEIFDKLRHYDSQHGSQRKVTLVITPGLVANGDYHLIHVMLENLLSNAWKYTSKVTDARIKFGTNRQDGETIYYLRDNGIGFDMQYADKIFDAFKRLHADSQFEGSGIGLATVQRIIHRHGGRIWVEAEPSKGATFCFTLGESNGDTCATKM
jgi:PAS domain S-box-containing protein